MWAGAIGALGACSAVIFRWLIRAIQALAWRESGDLVLHAQQFPAWERVLIPCVGGALAGLVLMLGARVAWRRHTGDHLEAIALGQPSIPVRNTLFKSLSSLLTIASGGSIGREGVMVQLSAMLASVAGRLADLSVPRRRLLLACGAAAGIASAYNAPLAGALFVSEVALGTIAMETLGPLVCASVVATATTRQLVGPDPLFKIPAFQLVSALELVPYALLGVALGLIAAGFVRFLALSERGFARLPLPLWMRLALGGAVVGLLSIRIPEVWGNGYAAVSAILAGGLGAGALLLVLVCKVAATGATAGSGAVGGVFTPTLFVGAACGQLFGQGVHALAPDATGGPSAYALVGMASFLAAATQAPLMSMLIVFEMTLDYGIVLPLMLGCVVAWSVVRGLGASSLYEAARAKAHSGEGEAPLARRVTVRALLKPVALSLTEEASFDELERAFAAQRVHSLFVTDADGRLLGAVSLHELSRAQADPELSRSIRARDLVRYDFPWIERDATLAEALTAFVSAEGELLPVIDGHGGHMLVGAITKTDLMLSLSMGAAEPESSAAPDRA